MAHLQLLMYQTMSCQSHNCHTANYQDCAVSLLGIPVGGSADGVVVLSLTGLAASVVGEGCVVCVALALREVACIVKRIGAQ